MRRIELDFEAAIDVADALSDRPGFAFLDSAAPSGEVGRWSFVGIEPFGTFRVADGVARWNGEALAGPPLDALRQVIARYRLDEGEVDGASPFRGGGIGFVSYDFGARLDERPPAPGPRPAGEELLFRFYDLVLAFDHRNGRCLLYSSGLPETDRERRAARAAARAEGLLALLRKTRDSVAAVQPVGPWRSNFTAETYAAAVERVRAYIAAGDIYQANIAQRFEASLPSGFDAWAFYRRLRHANPAPFGAFLALDGGRAIASSSPERFLRCGADGAVEARPIKGTARRAADSAEDLAAARTLAASEKDRAENVMIVDLLRNDLSRVCRPGTVAVPVLCGLESYASVHHLTSVVTGRLREGFDGLDLVAAAFPCGSITGAPKLRAMEIIAEIEGAGRGIYCGAIGWLGFDGAMDLNVAIRTVALEPSRARFGAGGGVTLLSDPAAEYRETLAKAERIFAAFEPEEPPCSS
ncbi:aminodeoxychorismate synthase component I [Aureimonas leprariae]|uniref:aminodeoxychorismate synthase n=1 Tax=Plantimonas leprariae TaxID=2615207 RepID=A0A7V7PT73_9HYPH|nr:aminodeoxychorismate synthase component I [Aureimonas leprariae]KAB0682837.1 aminodeoxychorismate synthase component I [Aureimonas leprariae]